MLEICSKLTIKAPEWRQLCCSGVFIDTFEQIPRIVIVFSFEHTAGLRPTFYRHKKKPIN